ncbi:hypothetical protein F0562_016317 [Nyssa sinensis]|uniref:C2 domain-containing protein n=1 Tax=Nyssa sinensis TaxID=561372 RepID=A0A5J4ZLV1_9ASTE|nr:hypothetical protein F0562_016317 [Nyssa sinensis]
MGSGILEVLLVDAQGIKENEFLGCFSCLNPCKGAMIDPYVVIHYGNQKRSSCVAQGKGKKLLWNETLKFDVEYPGGEDDTYKLIFRMMDKHKLSEDDYVGETKIYVKDVVSTGMESGKAKLEARKYRVVQQNKTYNGEISVAITFTRNE